jgi:hypothetical protein
MASSSPYCIAIKNSVRNLFLINLLIFVPLSLISQVNAQAATLPGYSLVGTIRSGDFSGAVVIVSKGEQSFFRLFEKLPDGSQLIKVREDSIVLKGTDGLTYEMYILHETRNVPAVPYSPFDPFAGGVRQHPAKRPLSAYERVRQSQSGKQADDE